MAHLPRQISGMCLQSSLKHFLVALSMQVPTRVCLRGAALSSKHPCISPDTHDSKAVSFHLEVHGLFALAIHTSGDAASARLFRVLRNQLRKTAWGSGWNLLFCLCYDINYAILRQKGAMLIPLMGKMTGNESVKLAEYWNWWLLIITRSRMFLSRLQHLTLQQWHSRDCFILCTWKN